ncbi:MAG: flotillin family protein [Kiritimatiellae bacterium]|nr:flotillin family protein [Kiritimatiellia bacterium]
MNLLLLAAQQSRGTSTFVVLLCVFAAVVFVTLLTVARFYKRCPSDRILVVYGKVKGGRSAHCIHGGGAFIVPLVQDYAYIGLTPMTINIPLQNALSFQNIRINVPSTFTVGVSTDPAVMVNAAERLLGLRADAIEGMAKEIIFGQLRLTVASLTIEQINQDRESFLAEIRKNVEPELNKIGLNLINVNITDITDESTYIESIGKKAAAEAINKAKVDVAKEQKVGAIGEAENNRDMVVSVRQNAAEAEMGKKKAEAGQRVFVAEQEAAAVDGENASKAQIAESNSKLAVRTAEAMRVAEVANRAAEAAIQKAQYDVEIQRLAAAEIAKKETERKQIQIAAEAEADRVRTVAKGEADGVLMKYQAEAEGVRTLLAGKAAGYKALVESAGGNAQAAATLLMIEKLEDIVARQAQAISNLKIDKVTVWDSAGGGEKGSSTANFVSSLVKSLPPLQDVASMAGVELPSYLGKVKAETPAAPAAPASGAPAAG